MTQASGIKGKLEVARHDADDGIGSAIEVDSVAKNMGIANHFHYVAHPTLSLADKIRRLFLLALGWKALSLPCPWK